MTKRGESATAPPMDITDRRSDPLPAAGKLRLVNDGGVARLLDANGRRYRLRPEAGTPVNGVAATGTLTGTTIAWTNTVTIGGVAYVFEESDLETPNSVLLGASDSDGLDNLIAAINGAAGEGTLYGTGTVAHPTVSAAAGSGDTMVVTARTVGAAGNAITTTAALTAGSWGAATLAGGVTATEGQAGDQMYDGSYLYTAVADVLPTSTTGWEKSATAAI